MAKYQIIIDRTLNEAEYILEKQCTVRQCAKHFRTSKSTVHKDLKQRLVNIDFKMYQEVCKLLQFNFNERNIRGGIATQRKYKGLEV